MVRVIIYISVFILSLFFSVINAQNKETIPCSSPEYSQFNFWIGNWNVYDTKGKLIGTNNVVKLPNACAIQENWVSKTSPNQGTSYNYYNKTNNSWNQVWVDNSGFSLALKGSYSDQKMILKSKIIKSPKRNYYNQITWINNKDDSVTQIWSYMDENHSKIKEVFRGVYKKHKSE